MRVYYWLNAGIGMINATTFLGASPILSLSECDWIVPGTYEDD